VFLGGEVGTDMIMDLWGQQRSGRLPGNHGGEVR
jgi:hypothetical protein